MKKIFICLLLSFVVLFIATLPSCFKKSTDVNIEIKKQIINNFVSFKNYITDSFLTTAMATTDTLLLQQKFVQTRKRYKQIEWIAEYYMPNATRMVNGPPLPEIETEENKVVQPDGLQVIEAMIYATAVEDKNELQRQVKLLISKAAYYENYLATLDIDNAHIFDAARLAVFRSITLGITGFDAPLARTSIAEATEVFSSIRKSLAFFETDKEQSNSVSQSCIDAEKYLQANLYFDAFDRMTFIKTYATNVSRSIAALKKDLHIADVMDSRLLKPTAITLFDKGAFDVNAYVQDSTYYFSTEKAILGKKIFYDNILSSNNSRNCASCHNPSKAFTDGLATSLAFSRGFIKRNAPTLLNAAFQPSQFYDLRATNLENQTADVIGNQEEMHGNFVEALKKINKNEDYLVLLKKAYSNANTYTSFHIQNALASYIRTLSSLNSRFDEYMRAVNVSYSEQEKLGFNLFMGKAKCGTCHFMPLFNGTVPPNFLKIESEVIGIPKEANGKTIDNDSGRYLVNKLDPFLFAFKTTTVRNVALTAPYMHNGVFKNLEQVVSFYNNGGGKSSGANLKNLTLPFDKLLLTKTEEGAIVSFMKTLTDTSSVQL
jgi:cytochrome c peroxidase